MIELHSPLRVEPNRQGGGWELVFWTGDTFDYRTPFRAVLADIAEALGQDRQIDLELPTYEDEEDFVEGALSFGDMSICIYYEHSLSYLALMSDSEGALRDVADRVQAKGIVSARRSRAPGAPR